MEELRRKPRTPSRSLAVLFLGFLGISAFVFFNSCRLLVYSFPDSSLKEYEFFISQSQPQQQPTASRVLTTFPGNRLRGASIAYQQSYGFFDDILDHNWRLMQERAWSSLHVKGQALPDILHSSNHENPTLVSSYLNNLQVGVVQSIVPILNACIVKGERFRDLCANI
jgi:hypothetical protein